MLKLSAYRILKSRKQPIPLYGHLPDHPHPKLSFSGRLFKDACCPPSILARFSLIADGDKLEISKDDTGRSYAATSAN
jgi:hypothetical protein